jgi:hypothetical protein
MVFSIHRHDYGVISNQVAVKSLSMGTIRFSQLLSTFALPGRWPKPILIWSRSIWTRHVGESGLGLRVHSQRGHCREDAQSPAGCRFHDSRHHL